MSNVRPLVKRVAVTSQSSKSQDLDMMKFILEMRYVTPVQIQKQFFKGETGKERDLAVKAISDLLTKGLLKLWRSNELQDDSLVMVAESGRNAIVLENQGKLIPNITKTVFPPRLKHDMLLNELRIRFEEINFITKWVSDAHMAEMGLILRTFEKDRPDAICKKKDGKSYFLELEVAEKGAKAYRDRMGFYLEVLKKEEVKEQKITGVIFFCKNEEVQKKIKSLIPEGAKGISVMPYDKYFLSTEERRAIILENKMKAEAEKNKEEVPVKEEVLAKATVEPAPSDIFNL